MTATHTSDRAIPRASNTLPALAPIFAILLQARASLGALVALAIARHLLRLAPTLSIGLAVDHVASARAGATLVAIVSLLCVAAAIELAFAGAQQRLNAALRAHLAAMAGDAASRRRRARHGAALDLLVNAASAPPAMLAMIAALAMASGRLAALAFAMLLLQAAATVLAGGIVGRLAAILRTAERRAEHWTAETAAIAEVLRAGGRLRAGRLERRRARLARLAEARRDAAARLTTLIGRIGFAAMLGLGCLEAMSAAITPGALIATMLVLRQLQSLADGLDASWLRAVDAAAEPAPDDGPAPRRPRAPAIDLVPGEFVAVVGGTAAGKSLLLRGLIERAGARGGGAARAAWVEQQPRLCDATIAETLRLAEKTRDETRRREAIRASRLAQALPRTLLLDHPCGMRGEALSAGQRGLVALAAALYSDPRLLVLDALPDALEPALRAALLAELQAWRRRGRTLVVATSVESWIAAADRVVVVEAGRVRADLRPRRAPPRAA